MLRTGVDYYKKHNIDENVIKIKLNRVKYLFSRLSSLKIGNSLRVLDVGCGLGVYGAEFGKKYNSKVYGIDLERGAIKVANSLGLKAKNSDIDQKWPYTTSSFDAVLGIQIIEHVYDTDHFFLESRRVLKDCGLLIITTPNLAAWYNRIVFLFGYQPFFTEVSMKDKTIGLSFTRKFTSNREAVGHLRVFTLKAMKEILALYDFKIEKIIGGSVDYLPGFMKPFDKIFTHFPALSSDIILIARNQKNE